MEPIDIISRIFAYGMGTAIVYAILYAFWFGPKEEKQKLDKEKRGIKNLKALVQAKPKHKHNHWVKGEYAKHYICKNPECSWFEWYDDVPEAQRGICPKCGDTNPNLIPMRRDVYYNKALTSGERKDMYPQAVRRVLPNGKTAIAQLTTHYEKAEAYALNHIIDPQLRVMLEAPQE